VVLVLYKFHLCTTAACAREHTDVSLLALGALTSELLVLLQASPLIDERPSNYLTVKAHLFFTHLPKAIKALGSLANADTSLMESEHRVVKADAGMTNAHRRTSHVLQFDSRRYAFSIATFDEIV
jgi:hypothetical protein